MKNLFKPNRFIWQKVPRRSPDTIYDAEPIRQQEEEAADLKAKVDKIKFQIEDF